MKTLLSALLLAGIFASCSTPQVDLVLFEIQHLEGAQTNYNALDCSDIKVIEIDNTGGWVSGDTVSFIDNKTMYTGIIK